jgi:hypothetical protein
MYKTIVLTGQKLGDLEVIRKFNAPYEVKKERRKTTLKLECRCGCGRIFYPYKTNVLSKKTTHCQRCALNYQYIGKKFGSLLVLRKDYTVHKRAFLCKCDCGKEDIIQSRYLSKGKPPQVCKYCRHKKKYSNEPKLTREESIRQTNYLKHLKSKEKILSLQFPYFKVLAFSHWKYVATRRLAFYLCKCVCRKHFVARGDSLVSGKHKSCGCKNEYASGENQAHAKLTNKEAEEIRGVWQSGLYKQSELAEMFKVSISCIGKITSGLTYN